MATNMPTGLDTFTDPNVNDTLDNVGGVTNHHGLHAEANDALLAVEKMLVGPAVYNVKGYGAKGDGSTNDATAIQAAITAANSAGGGVVYFPAGTYIIGATLTLYTHVHLLGAGIGATVLQLAASVNAAVIQSNGFAGLTGTNGTGGIANFSIRDLTIDGNRGNNTAGYGLRLYGYGYILADMAVKNAAFDGIYSEWSTSAGSPGEDDMIARVHNVKVHECGADGIHWRGPHDSFFSNVDSWENGQTYGQLGSPTGLAVTGATGGSLTASTTYFYKVTAIDRDGYESTCSSEVSLATGSSFTKANLSWTATTNAASYNVYRSTSSGAEQFLAGSATNSYSDTGALSTSGPFSPLNNFTGSSHFLFEDVASAYSGGSVLLTNCHAWGTHGSYDYRLEGIGCSLSNCVGEGASSSAVLINRNNCAIQGGLYFSATNGIQIGSTQATSAYGIDTLIQSCTTAEFWFCNDGGNSIIKATTFQTAGSTIVGTPATPCAIEIAAKGTGAISLTIHANNGPVALGYQGIATNATTGHVWLPTCAGTPTGSPTTPPGTASLVPCIVDSSGGKLWVNFSGTWKSVTFA